MRLDALSRHYEQLESEVSVVDRTADYSRLVVPSGNANEPVHRWFHLKEAYSHQLLGRLLKDAGWESRERLSVLDPFSGGGTTLVSAADVCDDRQIKLTAFGIERNPFLQIVSAAKSAAIIRGCSMAADLEDAADSAMRSAAVDRTRWSTPSSTLNNQMYFDESNVQALLGLREAVAATEDEDVRAVLTTCVAASVEAAGKLRRDGRALRYAPERTVKHPFETFAALVDLARRDLQSIPRRPSSWSARVISGDARHANIVSGRRKFEWIVFSPPYANNIDYTEVYKMESWVLGLWDDAAQMKRQRLSTIRSHPSIRFPDEYAADSAPYAAEFQALIEPLVRAIPRNKYYWGRVQLVRGYADDLLAVFIACRRVVAEHGKLAYVVGNSVHGSGDEAFVIAADILLARLARIAGWEVEEVGVARYLSRRGAPNVRLRESVVVLRPTSCR